MLHFTLEATENDGRGTSFEFIYKRYHNMMLKIATDILKDHAAAEDAVQEAFIKLLKIFYDFDLEHSRRQKNFLIILIRNTAIDILRKRMREELEFVEDHNTLDQLNYKRWKAEDVFQERFYEAVIKLPNLYRDTFTLKYQLGHTDYEIGRILGVSPEAVRKRISRGRKILEQILENH